MEQEESYSLRVGADIKRGSQKSKACAIMVRFEESVRPHTPTIKIASRPFRRFINSLWDKRLDWELPVRVAGKNVFEIYDYGRNTRFRGSSFEAKELETLEWIESFSPDESLLDIGANVGIYTLYAASRGHRTVAIEPDALNYALLNRNIRLNGYGERVMPYLIAAHNETKFSSFNISSHEGGGGIELV